MDPNSPACFFSHASMAGSRSTAPLNRNNSVLIVAPLFYVIPYTRRPRACRANDIANMRCMPETPERRLKGMIDKFDPTVGMQIRQCRSAMRKRFPTANELVYDNYNFFVIGYCTTERPSDCVVSLAANSKGIGLSFYRGATLPDPHRILQGGGNQNRFVRLDGVATLSRPEIQELIA